MTVGILVDPSCDLPTPWYQSCPVTLVPNSLMLNDQTLVDERDVAASQAFYRPTSAKQRAKAERHCDPRIAAPNLNPDSNQNGPFYPGINSNGPADALTANLPYQYDQLLIVTPHPSLSLSLPSVRATLTQAQPQIDALRQAARLVRPFRVRVLDSQSGYAGYGLVLHQALRLLGLKGYSVDQLKQSLDGFKVSLTTLVQPGQRAFDTAMLRKPPYQLGWLRRQQLKLTARRPIFQLDGAGAHWVQSHANANFENDFLAFAHDRLMHARLSKPLVNLSYAGDLAHLREQPMFTAMHRQIRQQGGTLLYSMMALSSALQLGLGALSLAFVETRR